MNKHIANSLEDNWDNLKNSIQAQWKKLTDEDLEQISGSYDRFIAKLKKAYSLKSDVLEDEISEFLINNNIIQKPIEKQFSSTASSIKTALNDYFDDYIKYIKNKSKTLETSTQKHVKENPIKWISVAAVSGFVLAKLIRF